MPPPNLSANTPLRKKQRDTLLFKAFRGENPRTPVWLMRQAGRVLPQYRALRERHSLEEMFTTPELAARVTLLPVKLLDVDAAILFADILTLPAAMGFAVSFPERKGPVIANPLTQAADLMQVRALEDIPHIRQTIRLTLEKLPKDVALLGFAGAPWTVLSYLLRDTTAGSLRAPVRVMIRQPEFFARAMELITENTIRYLQMQQEAGIEAFQLFDSWAGLLRPVDYERYVLPHVQRIFAAVDLPSIYYIKNCAHLLPAMEKSGAQFLSVCETVDFSTNPVLAKTSCGVQGNLYNAALYYDRPALQAEVIRVLKGARKFSRYIFNLSHGLLPDTDLDKIKFLIEAVRKFKGES